MDLESNCSCIETWNYCEFNLDAPVFNGIKNYLKKVEGDKFYRKTLVGEIYVFNEGSISLRNKTQSIIIKDTDKKPLSSPISTIKEILKGGR